MVVYFGEEVENALKSYLYTTRKNTAPCRDMKMPSSFPLSAGVWVSRQLKIWSANMPVK